MFTGIVEEVGIVSETRPDGLSFNARKVLEGSKVGDSIAVNGACLTIICLENLSFSVNVMPETLRRTNLGRLHYGDRVNLERAVMVGSRLGGHFVLGHVDDIGKVMDVTIEETARIMKISAPARLMPYVVEKGFIAVDGVSLTVVDVDELWFVVSLVPYTLENTTLGLKARGDVVNLEVDILAKYVESLKERKRRTLSLEFLEEYGFAGGTDAV